MPNNIPPFTEIDNATQWHNMGTPDVHTTGSVTYWVQSTGTFEIVAPCSDRYWQIYDANQDHFANLDAKYPLPISDNSDVSMCVETRTDYSRNS